jgi:hypothetical protein
MHFHLHRLIIINQIHPMIAIRTTAETSCLKFQIYKILSRFRVMMSKTTIDTFILKSFDKTRQSKNIYRGCISSLTASLLLECKILSVVAALNFRHLLSIYSCPCISYRTLTISGLFHSRHTIGTAKVHPDVSIYKSHTLICHTQDIKVS